MQLIIVESPTKAKTISKFLGSEYKVLSSFGHVRDLPAKSLGIDIKNSFEPEYEITANGKKSLAEIKKEFKKSDYTILATDEDREGEAISWHLKDALKLKNGKYGRIVFHEITKNAILNALKTPRDIDINLVDAQQARRILDRLVGYKLSPFLWKKVAKGLSAGRVQSVAVRLITEREREREAFKQEEYWSISALFNEGFEGKLAKKDGKTLDKLAIVNQDAAEKIISDLSGARYKIEQIEKKETKKNPLPPFTTSTLQQEANRRLGYSSKQTMMIAQQLYENGHITYMRTDSMNLSAEAIGAMREYIGQNIGKKYLPENAIFYKTKSKGAQEAHEAIRPTNPSVSPEKIGGLDAKQQKIYALIWQRAVACQMNPAIIDSTAVDISAGNFGFKANGATIKFDGFLKIYPSKTEETILPELKEGQILNLKELKPEQHFTQPPARYSEAGLIKAMEEFGIGRPSTYAPTISTIIARKYIDKDENKKLFPTEIGKLVNDVLVEHFSDVVDYKFTAKMEEDLDEIADGKRQWVPVIKEFYEPFAENLENKSKNLSKKDLVEEATDEICDKCGSPMVIKVGRYGKFLACSKYPECKNTKPLGSDGKPEEPEKTDEICDKCGSPMVIKQGRFGKFLACSAYPACKNIKNLGKEGKPAEPVATGVKCPECGSEIVEKRSRRGKNFYGCSGYPKCKFALWNKPTGEKCKKCGSLMVLKITKKNGEEIVCSNKECV
ncbi:MAG: type I DNA topoisomerase [bacterium]